LGIDSKKRKNLNSQLDYDNLFNEYEKEVLPERIVQLEQVLELLTQYRRIALTCFEAAHTSCHRGRITDYFEVHPRFNYEITHL
jgi:uncharacterized protein (DUF488 family)